MSKIDKRILKQVIIKGVNNKVYEVIQNERDFKFVNLLKFGIFLIFVNYDGVLVCDVYYVLQMVYFVYDWFLFWIER